MTELVLFYAFAAVVLVWALLTVTARNVFHSALYLAMSLFGVAAVFALLGSFFLAGLQVLLYIGAVVVLSIFVISMTRNISGAAGAQFTGLKAPAAVVALLTGGLLTLAVTRTPWETPYSPSAAAGGLADDAAAIGLHLLSDFSIPFEAVSVLLLAALLGAVAIIAKDNA